MLLTLFCDASFDIRHGVGGWGAWAKREDWPRGEEISGPIRGARNSTEAELLGITAAVVHAANNSWLQQSDLLVQCDNVAALAYLNKYVEAKDKPSPGGLRVSEHGRPKLNKVTIRSLRTLAEVTNGAKLYVRHVKGHANADDGRSWVNQRCDSLARSAMQICRKEMST